MQRRPPPYPPPITPPEQQRAAQEFGRLTRELSSPLMMSRFPMDGFLGMLFIVFMTGVLIFANVSVLKDFGLPTRGTEVVMAVSFNVAALAMIVWGVHVRRGHRRLRRFERRECIECGYSLQELTGPKCPECGAPALRLPEQAQRGSPS